MISQADRGQAPSGMAAVLEVNLHICHSQEMENTQMKDSIKILAAQWCIFSIACAGPILAQEEKIGVTGERLPGLEQFDRAMIAFMRQYKIPGASMAIVKNGRLVYAGLRLRRHRPQRAGEADLVVSHRQRLQTHHGRRDPHACRASQAKTRRTHLRAVEAGKQGPKGGRL